MLFSVIIPVYNCEKYVSATLDSILNQGLSQDEYEIIVVNDGSTDRSSQIAQKYARDYSNIKVVEQSNQGVATARNRGLRLASGQYVHFVDGDDQIEANSYVRLKELAKSNPDVIKFDEYRVEPYRKNIEAGKQHKIGITFSGTIEEFVHQYGIHVSAVFFLFRRSLLLDNYIFFENYKLGEDGLFCLKVLHQYSNTIVYTDAKIYKYIIHSDSTLRNNNRPHLKAIIEGIFPILDEIRQIASDSKYNWEIFEEKYDSLVFNIGVFLLRGNFSVQYNNTFLCRLRERNLFPFKGVGLKTTYLNFFAKNGVSMWFGSLFHRYVYETLIKPFVKTV